MEQNARLGKGLAALVNNNQIDNSNSAYKEKFDIGLIEPNPYQPRMRIEPEELIEIADSIREHGVIQPLILSKDPNSDKYFVVAGERRFRASKLAGKKHVPVVIKDTSAQDMLEIALIENIQRKDLNALEEAFAFKQLQEEFGIPQEEIAKSVGLSRVAVTNKMRLLNLPDPIKESIMNEEISEGHARALLGIKDETSLVAAGDLVVKRGLTVRQTEELVRKINFGTGKSTRRWRNTDPLTLKYSEQLSKKLGYTANITKMTKGGKITIRYNSQKELKELMKKML